MAMMRSGQMETFREIALDKYATRVAGELRVQFPEKLRNTSDPELKQLVRLAVNRARPYRVVSEEDVKRFAEFMVEYGETFDLSPWANPLLTSPKTAGEKMDDLDAHATFEMRA